MPDRDDEEEPEPTLVARFRVKAQEVALVEEFARREGIRMDLVKSGGAYASILIGRFSMDEPEDRRNALDSVARRVREICQRSIGTDRFEFAEVVLTLFPDGSMNADFFLPRELLQDAIEYDLDILIAAH